MLAGLILCASLSAVDGDTNKCNGADTRIMGSGSPFVSGVDAPETGKRAKCEFERFMDVKTKQSKTMRTTWYPTDQIFETIFVDWHKEMRSMGASDEAPLFPRSYHQRFSAAPERALTLDFTFYQSSDHARKVVRQAAELAGVVQFTPHAIRTTIGRRIAEWGITAAERKANEPKLGARSLRNNGNLLWDN